MAPPLTFSRKFLFFNLTTTKRLSVFNLSWEIVMFILGEIIIIIKATVSIRSRSMYFDWKPVVIFSSGIINVKVISNDGTRCICRNYGENEKAFTRFEKWRINFRVPYPFRGRRNYAIVRLFVISQNSRKLSRRIKKITLTRYARYRTFPS